MERAAPLWPWQVDDEGVTQRRRRGGNCPLSARAAAGKGHLIIRSARYDNKYTVSRVGW